MGRRARGASGRATVMLTLLLACVLGGADVARAAIAYASPQIEARWRQVEAVQPNFWGPLATAREGRQEAYREGSGGMRLVQYFDKARMEQRDANAPITAGLLTIELTSGRLQTGDATFEMRAPAKIGIAGDTAAPGPTYADLASLPERVPDAASTPAGYLFTVGQGFRPLAEADERQFAATFNPPSGPALAYLADPTGRYGQVVYQPFLTFIAALPVPIAESTGYPVSPLFVAEVRVGGQPTTVLVQAFERRVLTYNPNNPPATRVEFGNIGQHYYQWRYGS